ncbi:unnamed protein product [Rotaria sordida]|uniref:Uncharacterized protein n=1 Tax=Rotaria sordida TaxID=392033 RepID=A0A815PR11_9BILA|nr:unnamed protein product [Rotaria sordida]CAF4101412.1 unnamed protein product [Rotaria sordida]
MPGSSVELSTKIINHLKYTYGIDDSNAHTIYNEATNLYHELLAMIDLSPLRTTDNKILSSLIIIICEYYDFGEISGLFLPMIMYIITFCQNTEAEYYFLQWIGTTKVFLQINFNISQFTSFRDLLKSLQNNTDSMEEQMNKKGTHEQQQEIKEFRTKFNSFLNENGLILSDESEDDQEDDDGPKDDDPKDDDNDQKKDNDDD